MTSALLADEDEGDHPPGSEPSWNESRYVDVFDAATGVGAWLRLGHRPNEGHCEMSVCVNLPDGSTAFLFRRADGPTATGQSWTVDEPYRRGRVQYSGEVLLLPDAWALTDPKRAYATSERMSCEIDLTTGGLGLASVLGSDQSHIERIFLPGQADWHYQHLVRVTGTIRIGERDWRIDARGARDHSWGPRHWLAKTWFRWLTGAVDDDLGFMLTRAVGPTKQTRGGFVWEDGTFHLVDGFDMHNRYAGPPHHELLRTDVVVTSGQRTWTAVGEPRSWVPLRHRHATPDGPPTVLRIVKSPTTWEIGGRAGTGMLEYHDRMDDGVPAGLHD